MTDETRDEFVKAPDTITTDAGRTFYESLREIGVDDENHGRLIEAAFVAIEAQARAQAAS